MAWTAGRGRPYKESRTADSTVGVASEIWRPDSEPRPLRNSYVSPQLLQLQPLFLGNVPYRTEPLRDLADLNLTLSGQCHSLRNSKFMVSEIIMPNNAFVPCGMRSVEQRCERRSRYSLHFESNSCFTQTTEKIVPELEEGYTITSTT